MCRCVDAGTTPRRATSADAHHHCHGNASHDPTAAAPQPDHNPSHCSQCNHHCIVALSDVGTATIGIDAAITSPLAAPILNRVPIPSRDDRRSTALATGPPILRVKCSLLV
jgi:hypothetical protein